LIARASSAPRKAAIDGGTDGDGAFTVAGGVARMAARAAMRINIEIHTLSKSIV
jgi:hypothetical protein